jgi:hypothetical protein
MQPATARDAARLRSEPGPIIDGADATLIRVLTDILWEIG